MRKSLLLVAASIASIVVADAASAQPGPFNGGGRPPQYGQQRPQDRGAPQQAGNHYYNGRWVGDDEWRRNGSQRDQWARDYQRRRGDNDNASAAVAAIIGFALGAAIVGSQQQAEHARTADAGWDRYCARKYRSYDRRSRTYLGFDGARHYCQ